MIATLPRNLRRAVSPYVGIVRTVEECLPATTDPVHFQAACEVGAGLGTIGSPLGHVAGLGGAGRTRSAAAAAAVGEALERYSATFVPSSELVVASARELGEEAVRPERFSLFSERQYATEGFPYRRFTSETRVAWVRGRELRTGRSALLPAELVFLGRARPESEAPIGYSTSSGLACADTREESIARGLCELLERDAFMIVWANRLSLPHLEASPGSPVAALGRELFAPTGLHYAAVDLSPFHRLPSVLGIVRAPAGMVGAIGVGAGTAPTIEQAWWKAFAEAFASRAAGVKFALLEVDRDLQGAGVETFDDRILYHADPSHAAATRFLDASALRRPVDSVSPLEGRSSEERVAALCERVRSAGSTAYEVDVTSPDVAELGLAVTRVIAPELCPLDASHSARFLGGARLYEGAAAIGLRAGALHEDDLNDEPHPFP